HDEKEKYAIELKFPRNGQHPEQMYSFVKDIKFMEELQDKENLKELCFINTYVLTLVDDKLFYSKPNKDNKDKKITMMKKIKIMFIKFLEMKINLVMFQVKFSNQLKMIKKKSILNLKNHIILNGKK
ncbi:MAG: hypothetical protein IKG79_03185, partial [Neisseriaceae bacterium]|nr:hypothetical protein [Neisseriaceae bacterium]